MLELAQAPLDANFFDLGGHSLLLAQVHLELEATFERTISITDLFEYPTITSLSAFLCQQWEGDAAPATEAANPATRGAEEADTAIAIIEHGRAFPRRCHN